MDKKIEARLALEGWTVTCEHPFELSHEDGSFASGQAAQIVCESFENRDFQRLSHYQKLRVLHAELCDIQSMVDTWVNRALNTERNLRDQPDLQVQLWETLYNLVFSVSVNQQVHKLASSLELSFDWDDPDSDYKDDVLAFARGLKSFVQSISPFLGEDSEDDN